MNDWQQSCEEHRESIIKWRQSCEYYWYSTQNPAQSRCQSGQMALSAKQLNNHWFESNPGLQQS